MVAATGIDNPVKMLLIGGSAGSLKVILEMLPNLRNDLPFPIIIILHRKADPESVLDVLLTNYTKLPVVEAGDKMSLNAGTIYLAPPDYHLLFENQQLVSLDCSEKMNYSRPSIDVSFQSAAQIFTKSLVAILLSGANADGVEGLEYVKRRGGMLIVQDPATAEVEYMPKQALQRNEVDYVLKPSEMATFINKLYR